MVLFRGVRCGPSAELEHVCTSPARAIRSAPRTATPYRIAPPINAGRILSAAAAKSVHTRLRCHVHSSGMPSGMTCIIRTTAVTTTLRIRIIGDVNFTVASRLESVGRAKSVGRATLRLLKGGPNTSSKRQRVDFGSSINTLACAACLYQERQSPAVSTRKIGQNETKKPFESNISRRACG